jgi:hypothetical protein
MKIFLYDLTGSAKAASEAARTLPEGGVRSGTSTSSLFIDNHFNSGETPQE